MCRQIVITLPGWTEIKQIDNKQFADLLPAYDEMLNIINNGTPLPKGHGRLIDADLLEPDTEWDAYYDSFTSYSQMQISDAKTIVEADKE